MNAIVISGGGSKGAWAGGVAEYLHKDLNRNWKIFTGTSTGSLLSFNLPNYDFEKLKSMYTGVTNSSIFSVKPFKENGNIRILNAIWRLIRGKSSIGEIGNLRKLVMKNFSILDYLNLRNSSNNVIVTVSNMSKGTSEFFSSKDKNHTNIEMCYFEFVDAIIASTSVPIIAEPVKIGENFYLDGGILEHVPILKAIELGATEIDIIVLRPETFKTDNWKPDTMFNVLSRTVDLLQREVSFSDVIIADLTSKIKHDVKLNFYYTPTELSRNAINFNKEEMLKWWNEGRREFKNKKSKIIILKRKRD